jgi:putative ABC transport system substrate-binding protein
MERRAFVTGSLGLLGASLCAAAQQAGRVARVGVLLNSSGTENLRDLREGLRELGYIEGQTIILDVLSAEGRLDRLPALATELPPPKSVG